MQGLFNEMQALPKSVENGKEMARGDLDISGIPCKWISISHTKQGIRTRLVVYLVVKEPISYMVFCTAPEEKARKYEPLFEESMKSFRLL